MRCRRWHRRRHRRWHRRHLQFGDYVRVGVLTGSALSGVAGCLLLVYLPLSPRQKRGAREK